MKRAWWVVVLCAACGGSTSATREPDEYTGCATDENWRTFDDQAKAAVAGDDTGPALTAPIGSAPASSPPVVSWNQDPNDPGMPGGDVPHDGAACNNCCPEYTIGSLTTLHLPPISGNIYDLQFSVGGAVSYRVITTLQEWGPPSAVWAAWKGKQVSVRIWRMDLLANDVRPGVGGPFVATHPFTFTVGN